MTARRLGWILIGGMLLTGCSGEERTPDPVTTGNPAPVETPEPSPTVEIDPGPVVRGDLGRTLDNYLKALTAEGFSGSALVAHDNGIVLHQGYGFADAAGERPVTVETAFWIASVSKQFAAVAVLDLVEAGRLALEDPLERFFDDLPAAYRPITVHQLLTHTAGLGHLYAAYGVRDRDRAVKAITDRGLRTAPGEEFHYSSDGYSLLSAVVEVASGRRYETFLRWSFFDPLDMFRTGFWGYVGDAADAADLRKSPPGWSRPPNYGVRGASGILSTTGDLYRWTRALLNEEILDAASLERMFHPHVAVGSAHYGYGWYLSETPRGTQRIWIRGSESFGNNAIVEIYPDEDVVLVVLSHSGDFHDAPITRAVARELETRILNGKRD